MRRVVTWLVACLCSGGCAPSDSVAPSAPRTATPKPDLRITPELSARIRPGMTINEVVDAIGGPPGWYEGVGGISTDAPFAKGDRYESWIGRRGQLQVEFEQPSPQVGLRKVVQVVWYPAREVH